MDKDTNCELRTVSQYVTCFVKILLQGEKPISFLQCQSLLPGSNFYLLINYGNIRKP